MRNFKKIASRVAAFSMATVLTFSGALNNFSMLFNNVPGSFAGAVDTYAADSTGTVNADVFSWDNATVYYVLTDRFYNGNTSNDHSYNRGLAQNGSIADIQDDRATFHGGDFAGLTEKIEEGYFNELGVNAICLSAPYEQIHGYVVGSDANPSFPNYSYQGYYVSDYTQTDKNFGTEEEFRELVDTAHEHGIRVVIDIVLNHAGYNSMYDMAEYGFGNLKDGWEDFYYAYNNVNNKDYNETYIDYKSGADLWAKWWGVDWIRAGIAGYTEPGVSDITKGVEGLPDFMTESKKVVDIPPVLQTKWAKEGRLESETAELKNFLNKNGYSMTVTNCISYWLSTWVREYGVDGFRCDTAKHVEKEDWRILHDICTDALKEWKDNNPDKKLDELDFWMTGEHWGYGVSYSEYYAIAKFDSMINFDTAGAGVLGIGKVAGKYEDYAGAVNARDDFNILSYISSHDTTLARGEQVYLGSALLLLPGGVQILYGDETNRPMVGEDDSYAAGHSLRGDMNWDALDETTLAHWQKVGTFRNNHIAVGAGQHTSATASSGVGFVRTYSKGNVKDRIAAVIGASANVEVTLDVSEAWNDGDTVFNYYDSSAAVVSGGKVKFNSGSTGTILVGDPDGKPLVTIAGDTKFKGTQTVKVSLKNADYAVVSIDGGKNIKVVDGDILTIGDTGFDGDIITIKYKATNEKGTIKGKVAFYKAYPEEEIKVEEEEGEEDEKGKGLIRVKMPDGLAPHIYAWQGEDTVLLGSWPGTQLTKKDSDGYYYIELDTTDAFNMIIHNTSGIRTANINGVSGEVKVTVSEDSSCKIEASKLGSEDNIVNNIITIKIKPFAGVTSAPNLYVWSDKVEPNGGFPGKQLTEKDSEGNWLFTVEGLSSVSCIVGSGSNHNQTDNISGITGTATITINSEDYKSYDVEKSASVESKFQLMKEEARKIISWDKDVYTTDSWNKFVALFLEAKVLIDKREENADKTEVTNMYNKLVAASEALVVNTPTISAARPGTSVISGQSAQEAIITVVFGGKTYTATADELTGKWSINISSSLSSDSTFTVKAVKRANASVTATKQASNNSEAVTLTADLSLSTSSVKVGSTVKMTASANGGNGNYRYTYKLADSSLNTIKTLASNVTSSTYTWTATSDAVGTRYLVVTVSDGSTIATTQNIITVIEKPVVTVKAGNEQVKVSWNAVSGATKYQVCSYVDGKYTIRVNNYTETSYTVTGLTNGTKYGFLVRAYKNGAWTTYSTEDLIYATPTSGIIAKPTVTVTAGNGQVKVSWNAVSEATKYQVCSYVDGKYTIRVNNYTGTSYTVTGLTNGTKYGFLVRAYGNGAWTKYSTADLKYATPTSGTITKPTVTVTAGNGQVKVSWNAVSEATKYQVCSYVDGKYTIRVNNYTGTSYTVTGLTNGTKYGFLVRAYGNGAWTKYSTADLKYATPIDSGTITKPVVTVTAGNGQVKVSWNAVSGATKYQVCSYVDGKYTIRVNNYTGTSYTVTGLTNGTKYGFLVRAYVNGAWTSYSTADLIYVTPSL